MTILKQTIVFDTDHCLKTTNLNKVSFKRCSVSDRRIFSRAKCIIPVSVGVKVHEDEKFLATMRLINSSFQSCVLLVDDSIQKYTFKIDEPNLSLDELSIRAIHEGDKWLARNKDAYQSLTIPYKIMRWDDWRNHKNFEQAYASIDALYNTDEPYKQAMHSGIEDFICRHTARLLTIDNFDKQHAFNYCLLYLKEECAVMCLWAQEEFDFEVYPSGRNKAMIATYDKLIKPVYPYLLKSISLYFEKRKI